MKNCLLLLLFLFVANAATAKEKYYVRKAEKYIKKLGLEKHEVYYINKQDVAEQYITSEGGMTFPMNYVYNEEGLKVKAKYKNGDVKDIIDCFGTFADDFSAYVHDTGYAEYITVEERLEQEIKLLNPVFENKQHQTSTESVVIYYPAGLPFVKKSYKELVNRVKYHREKGNDIKLYFVMVRVMEHVDNE